MIYKDQLQAVYQLIEKPETWCQGHMAERIDGLNASANSTSACRWCLRGAAIHCKTPWLDDLDVALGVACAADFNDTHTHAEVLALLSSAIERAPERTGG